MRCQLVMLAGIPEGMRTVLFLSVYHASGENLALRLLIAQRGARNRAGQTALDIARQEGRGEIAQLLEGRAGAEAAGA